MRPVEICFSKIKTLTADAGRSTSLSYCVPFPPRHHVEAPEFGQGLRALTFDPNPSRICYRFRQFRQRLDAGGDQALVFFAAQFEAFSQVPELQGGLGTFQQHLAELPVYNGRGK